MTYCKLRYSILCELLMLITDGVHVIHQLAQAGRTLVAVILNCRNADFRPLIASSIEGLRSCVGLLRRFSGRYLCGLRSADIIDEFCRSKSPLLGYSWDISLITVCNIPVDSPKVPDETGRPSPAWLRPVRRRASRSPSSSVSPAANLAAYNASNDNNAGQEQDIMSLQPDMLNGQNTIPADLEALFNTSDYMDLSALAGSPETNNQQGLPSLGTTSQHMTPRASMSGQGQGQGFNLGRMTSLSESSGSITGSASGSGTGTGLETGSGPMAYPMSPNSTFANSLTMGNYMDSAGGINGTGNDNAMFSTNGRGIENGDTMVNGNIGNNNNNNNSHNDFSFEYSLMNGFGGEMLATEGMDTVSDGLRGGDGNQGL